MSQGPAIELADWHDYFEVPLSPIQEISRTAYIINIRIY